MMNILKKFKISYYTYIFILMCFLCGYIKNILIIFFICFFHELGHIFFIKLFKYDIMKVEILPFGGYTEIYKKINSNITKDIIISLGGIFNQIILFIILKLFKNNLNIITYNLFIKYNLTIMIFNLIPIIPLDGSKIIQSIWEYFVSFHTSYYLNLYFSIILFVIFIYLNYLYNIDNYFICSFLLYKIFLYYKNYKFIYTRFLIERSLYNFSYHRIINNTRYLKDLRKDVLHYFKENNHYVREDKIIKDFLCKKIDKSKDFW